VKGIHSVKDLTGVDISRGISEGNAIELFSFIVLDYKQVVSAQSANGKFSRVVLKFTKIDDIREGQS
jgi:hypothetical protein